MTECIHGLQIDVCDACSPRQAPERPRVITRAVSGSPRVPSGPVGVRGNRVENRVYLVIARTRLSEVLSALDDQDWRPEVGSATDAFRWPDASEVERPSDLVVLVANLSGALQLLATSNEPARRAVREELDAIGVELRVVLQPTWWSEA